MSITLPPPDVLGEVHDGPCPTCGTMIRSIPPIRLGHSAEAMHAHASAVSAAKDAEIAGLRAELIKSLADNAALRADAIDRQNNVVAPLRERVRELTTQAMFDTSTIERLRAEVAGLRAWLEADARCPCCDTTDACVEGCTFEADCPQDAERMAEVRALLAARKGEA